VKNPTGKLTGVVRRRMPDPDGLFTDTHVEVFEPEGATVPGVIKEFAQDKTGTIVEVLVDCGAHFTEANEPCGVVRFAWNAQACRFVWPQASARYVTHFLTKMEAQ
jgi:hypothetical protein